MKIDKMFFENLLLKLRQIPFDKLVHIVFAILLTLLLSAFFSYGIPMVLTIVFSILKEYYDKYTGVGVFDKGDIKYSIYGAIFGEILSVLIKYHWLLLF